MIRISAISLVPRPLPTLKSWEWPGDEATLYACVCGVCGIQQSELWVWLVYYMQCINIVWLHCKPIIQIAECTHHTHTRRVYTKVQINEYVSHYFLLLWLTVWISAMSFTDLSVWKVSSAYSDWKPVTLILLLSITYLVGPYEPEGIYPDTVFVDAMQALLSSWWTVTNNMSRSWPMLWLLLPLYM